MMPRSNVRHVLVFRPGYVLVALLAGAILSACHPKRIAHPRIEAGCQAFTVEGDRVLCGGEVVAELERFALGPGGCSGVRGYRGLAVRYATGERAWLFRARTMDPDHPERYAGPRGTSEFKLGWVGDVQLSPDGKKVFFRRPAIFFPDRFEYDISSGTLRKVEWTDPAPPEATALASCSADTPAR